jgi:hypothetical protein
LQKDGVGKRGSSKRGPCRRRDSCANWIAYFFSDGITHVRPNAFAFEQSVGRTDWNAHGIANSSTNCHSHTQPDWVTHSGSHIHTHFTPHDVAHTISNVDADALTDSGRYAIAHDASNGGSDNIRTMPYVPVSPPNMETYAPSYA